MTPKTWVGIGLATAVGIGIVAALALMPASLPLAAAQEVEGDLTAPSGDQPFGGARVGSYRAEVRGGTLEVRASFDLAPAEGQVLEGWLVDPQTGYKLSLGALQDGELRFEQAMVNPLTYGVLVITTEPVDDLDPNPAQPVGGAALPAPFGQ